MMKLYINGEYEDLPGYKGAPGKDGKSAYQYAVDGGYTGTEEEFKTLMGTGPWLPAVDGVVMQDVRIGGSGLTGKLIIDGPMVETPDGSSEQSAEPLIISSDFGVNPPIGSSQPLTRKWMTVDGPEINFSQDVTFNNRIWVGTDKAYIGNSKAATEAYVSNSINTSISNLPKIKSYTYTVNGPVAKGDIITFTISEAPDKFPYDYTNFPDNYFIYFGKKLKLKQNSLLPQSAMTTDYNFALVSIKAPKGELPSWNTDSQGNTWYSNMTFTVTCQCDKDIPSNTTVDTILVWVVNPKT